MNRNLFLLLLLLVFVLVPVACSAKETWNSPIYHPIEAYDSDYAGTSIEISAQVVLLHTKETVPGIPETFLQISWNDKTLMAMYSGEMPGIEEGSTIRVRGAIIPTVIGRVFWIAAWQPEL